MDPICLPIADFNTLLKEHIEQFNEHDIWITGEISQLKFYSKGNQYYFYLSDKSAAVNCVLYGSVLNYLKFNPENNQHVFARGKIKYLAKKYNIKIPNLVKELGNRKLVAGQEDLVRVIASQMVE